VCGVIPRERGVIAEPEREKSPEAYQAYQADGIRFLEISEKSGKVESEIPEGLPDRPSFEQVSSWNFRNESEAGGHRHLASLAQTGRER
jgi:hypothetical protein